LSLVRSRQPQPESRGDHAGRAFPSLPVQGLHGVHQIEDGLRYVTKKLHARGRLQARYSCHDLRHAFAVRLYHATWDVYQVEKALGHANAAVAEGHLRSLGFEG
jgi:integrase